MVEKSIFLQKITNLLCKGNSTAVNRDDGNFITTHFDWFSLPQFWINFGLSEDYFLVIVFAVDQIIQQLGLNQG